MATETVKHSIILNHSTGLVETVKDVRTVTGVVTIETFVKKLVASQNSKEISTGMLPLNTILYKQIGASKFYYVYKPMRRIQLKYRTNIFPIISPPTVYVVKTPGTVVCQFYVNVEDMQSNNPTLYECFLCNIGPYRELCLGSAIKEKYLTARPAGFVLPANMINELIYEVDELSALNEDYQSYAIDRAQNLKTFINSKYPAPTGVAIDMYYLLTKWGEFSQSCTQDELLPALKAILMSTKVKLQDYKPLL